MSITSAQWGGWGRREWRLLCLAARRRLQPRHGDQIRNLLQGPLDWDWFQRAARGHGVLGLVAAQLEPWSGRGLPEEVCRLLLAGLRANRRRNLFLTVELSSLLQLLEAARIPAIPYKGPSLALQAYGELGLRQFADLDILVARRDVPAVKELLMRQGYEPEYRLDPRQEVQYLENECQYNFRRLGGRILVEVHWELLPRSFDLRLQPLLAPLLGTAVPAGACWRELPPEENILLLCVHGFNHLWSRLVWVVDLVELLRTRSDMDWDRLWSLAQRVKVRRMVAAGLLLAETHQGGLLPRGLLQTLQREPKLSELVSAFLLRLSKGPGDGSKGLSDYLVQLRGRDARRQQLNMLAGLLTTPTTAERAPALLRLWRPLRLGGKYAARLARRLGKRRAAL